MGHVFQLPGSVVKQQKRLAIGYVVVNLFDQVVGMPVGDHQIDIAVVIVVKELQTPAAH